jgi:hypothetical protein
MMTHASPPCACEAFAVVAKITVGLTCAVLLSFVIMMRDRARTIAELVAATRCNARLADENDRLLRANATPATRASGLDAARDESKCADALPPTKRRVLPSSFLPLDDDFACTVCLEVLVLPVTQPCGHTLCWVCTRTLLIDEQAARCPLCRAPMVHAGVAVQLRAIVEKRYSALSTARISLANALGA